MTTPGAGHQVGSLADEAGQLIDAVTSRLQQLKADGAAVESGPASPHACVGWCPVCRGAELLRGDRSDISEKLVDTALVVLTTLRSLIPAPPTATTEGSAVTDPGDEPVVERIEIR